MSASDICFVREEMVIEEKDVDHSIYEVPLVLRDQGVHQHIIDFLGLDWDPEILRFFESKRVTHTASTEQVRKPIYKTSKQRWKRYEAHLGPLIEALDPEFRPEQEAVDR